MSIVGAFVLPHPPMAIPEVGRGQEKTIPETIEGYRAVARRIAELAPETIVVVSPHSIMYSDYLHISPGTHAEGDMRRFRAPQVRIAKDYDASLAGRIAELAEEAGLSAGMAGERDASIDHGVLVPLYFVEQEYSGYELVRCSISGLPFIDHYRFGQCIARAADELGRRVALIASGDLSHKLQPDGPYGFDPAGPVYDERLIKAVGSGDFGDLLEFDEDFCEEAAECGHRSFIVMAGALDGKAVEAHLLSHADITGVGYATAIIDVVGEDGARRFGDAYEARRRDEARAAAEGSDLFVRLARLSVESIVRDGVELGLDDPRVQGLIGGADSGEADGGVRELLETRAGAFVSIHEFGRLRGCIGTIAPTADCLASEILHNAVSASTGDPRFPPIGPGELDDLVINVDVLGDPEPISSMDELDVRRYGVIVTNGWKRGLLLPDLDGVDTPEQQVDIACRKAGIGKREGFSMERFEVVRHT